MEQEGNLLIAKLLDDKIFEEVIIKIKKIIDENLATNDYSRRNAHVNIKFVENLIPKSLLPNSSNQKTSGVINYYNYDRGFGYIDINQSLDIFFHIYDYHNINSGDPSIGEKLQFDIVETEKGFRAINILSMDN